MIKQLRDGVNFLTDQTFANFIFNDNNFNDHMKITHMKKMKN